MTPATKMANNSIVNICKNVVIIKNQKDTPKVVANALNLGDESSMSYRINQGN